jgi:hypothetical protein
MHHKKHLVTSGCSFTDTLSSRYKAWPIPLSENIGLFLSNYGLSSSGNDLICRQAMYGVDKLLSEGVNPKEILVGVMWSGSNRKDLFTTENSKTFLERVSRWFNVYTDEGMERHLKGTRNPYKFVPDSVGQWIIQNGNWPDILSQFSSVAGDYIGNVIITYEKILALQYYLESVGVDYFFTSYFGHGTFSGIKDNLPPDISWMHKLVDWEKWLPVDGEFEWCYDKGIKDYGLEGIATDIFDAKHPLPNHHEMFVKEVILPHLQKRKII